jgi:hypothetical protein
MIAISTATNISWVSPLGRALMKSAAGDSVVLEAPGGTEYLMVLEVRYERISVEPFRGDGDAATIETQWTTYVVLTIRPLSDELRSPLKRCTPG